MRQPRSVVGRLAVACVIAMAVLFVGGQALGQATISLVVDGRVVATDVPPRNIDGRILVPIRAVAEALGYEVSWDGAAQRVTVTTPAGGVRTTAASGGDGVDVSRLYAAAAPAVVTVLTFADDTYSEHPRLMSWGSGFVVDPAGLVYTNAHVVEGARYIKVAFADGTAYDVSVPSGVLADGKSDVAVLRFEPAADLPVLPLGDSDRVVVGEPVIAIGNPKSMQLRNTVTAGIVSGVGRGLGDYYPYIQTDAAINPGNSGGPLINARGEVIGITSMKFVEADVEGLAFAIPINIARDIASDLLTYGRAIRPWIGVVVEESWEASLGLTSDQGLRIPTVDPRGPAFRAGVRAGDYLMAVDGRATRSLRQLSDILLTLEVGDTVTLTLERPGAGTVTVRVTLAERPPDLDG